MQLYIINTFCAVSRQTQFDVLAEKASTIHDNGNVRDGDMIPCTPSLCKYWGYFRSMHGRVTLRPCVSMTTGDSCTICCAQRVGSRVMISRQYDLLSHSREINLFIGIKPNRKTFWSPRRFLTRY